MTEILAKPVSASRTVMTHLLFPEHANALGKAFGGQVMAWSDMAGGICSMRHSGGLTVTAAVDDLQFDSPLAIGDIAVLEARVNAAFGSSMEVEVEVLAEHPFTGERRRCVQALFTFVAIDETGQPRKIPGLLAECEDDIQRAVAARERRDARLAKRRAAASQLR